MQEMIDASMIEVCTEEDESPELVFLFCCCLYHIGYSRKNLSTSVEEIKKQLIKILEGTQKRRKSLVVIMQVFSFKTLI